MTPLNPEIFLILVISAASIPSLKGLVSISVFCFLFLQMNSTFQIDIAFHLFIGTIYHMVSSIDISKKLEG
ncbi:MAG TPA: hypothetical protein DDZ53_03390 [Firmicutes bacterium]|nr:hypothetical protein [Bacillota bacterium]